MILAAVLPALATDTHHLQVRSGQGAVISVINVPGAPDLQQTSFTESELDYLQTAANLAGWTTAEVSAWIAELSSAPTKYATLWVEQNPADPENPQLSCHGAAKDCQIETVPISGGGLTSLTLKLNF